MVLVVSGYRQLTSNLINQNNLHAETITSWNLILLCHDLIGESIYYKDILSILQSVAIYFIILYDKFKDGWMLMHCIICM